MSAMIGTVWWIISWFLYIKNVVHLKSSAGDDTVPIFWMWDHLFDYNEGWTALSYLSNFFAHGLVSFVELLAWFFYVTGNPEWLGWWSGTVGWAVGVYGLTLPWMFAVFQYAFIERLGGLN